MGFNRRQLLKASALASSSLAFPGIVRAASPWASLGLQSGNLPKYKVLEIFLPGGLSQWENFWVSHDLDGTQNQADSNRNWRGLEAFVAGLNWLPTGSQPGATECQPFGLDANNTLISWGPATKPIWRSDVMNRTRMLVTSHTDSVHNLAGFRTMTGRPFGSPRAASLGSPIQRHFQSLNPDQDIPFSYVLAPEHLGKDYWISNATALGQHPGAARPLAIKVGNPIGSEMQRTGISSSADAVFNNIRGQYKDLLHFHGGPQAIRSASFESYNSASDYLLKSEALEGLLGGETLQSGMSIPPLHIDQRGPYDLHHNRTHRSLEVAAKLLNSGARHIMLLDGGLYHPDTADYLRDSGTPYDTHYRSKNDSVEMTSMHLYNLLQGLSSIIENPSGRQILAAPGLDSSPHKISLDDTLILLHTEFNRSNGPSADTEINSEGIKACGRNHNSSATVALVIGGPVTSRGIQGGIGLKEGDANSSKAKNALSTTDVIAGTLLMSGTNPIDPDNFIVSDDFSPEVKQGGLLPADIRNTLKEKVFGLTNNQRLTITG